MACEDKQDEFRTAFPPARRLRLLFTPLSAAMTSLGTNAWRSEQAPAETTTRLDGPKFQSLAVDLQRELARRRHDQAARPARTERGCARRDLISGPLPPTAARGLQHSQVRAPTGSDSVTHD